MRLCRLKWGKCENSRSYANPIQHVCNMNKGHSAEHCCKECGAEYKKGVTTEPARACAYEWGFCKERFDSGSTEHQCDKNLHHDRDHACCYCDTVASKHSDTEHQPEKKAEESKAECMSRNGSCDTGGTCCCLRLPGHTNHHTCYDCGKKWDVEPEVPSIIVRSVGDSKGTHYCVFKYEHQQFQIGPQCSDEKGRTGEEHARWFGSQFKTMMYKLGVETLPVPMDVSSNKKKEKP